MQSNTPARLVSIGGIFAAFAILLQSSPVFLPGIGLLLSPFASLPIALASAASIYLGIITMLSSASILLLISPQEAVIFLLATGLLGLVLGASYNKSKIIYHNTELNIKITDVTVYPQGAATVYTLNRNAGKYIIVDIGAYTIDIALIEMINGLPTVIKYDTWFKGITTLHSKVAEAINNKFALSLDPQDVEQTLLDNSIIIDGKRTETSFLNTTIESYLEDIYYLLDLNYKSHITDIYLCGGGVSILYQSFKARYPQADLIKDAQFANANGYYQIGLQKYYKYIFIVKKVRYFLIK
jgi:hypothetical protein